ncbi:hypothetical protein QBC36DRAFT_348199 [Triangularia setosa]|uniref:Uncharacterized protein n=1 Tax=Triangularia setosa TaxID=2587417 RepID=A0AAN7A5J6_9PEZI|nr:hypothetical protein QBC36DRAFT_348199 [Podospora setosa]
MVMTQHRQVRNSTAIRPKPKIFCLPPNQEILATPELPPDHCHLDSKMSLFFGSKSSSSRNISHSYRDKHFSSSHGSRSKHRDRDPRASGTTIAADEDGVRVPTGTSFLFVVNELNPNYEPQVGSDLQGGEMLRDQWFNPMPPEHANEYLDEWPGLVFRYRQEQHGGVVTLENEYQWYRPGRGHEGHIVRVDAAGTITGRPMVYSQASIFSCGSHLPVIVGPGDASLGNSRILRQALDSDTVFYWSLLPICRWNDISNVSYVTTEGRGGPSVVGKNPSWIPSLVPQIYSNPNANLVSGGLSGDLSVLIGLMAFHSRKGRASEVFSSQKWHHNRWVGSQHAPTHVPRTQEDNPRGFYVQVCLDNLVWGLEDSEENDILAQECSQRIFALEWHSVLVKENLA